MEHVTGAACVCQLRCYPTGAADATFFTGCWRAIFLFSCMTKLQANRLGSGDSAMQLSIWGVWISHSPTRDGSLLGGSAASHSGMSCTTFKSLGSSILSAGQHAKRRCCGGGGTGRYGGASVADAGGGRELRSGSSLRSGHSRQMLY